MGASAVLATAETFASVAEAVADCTLVVGTTAAGQRDLQHLLRDLGEAAPLIWKAMQAGQVGLLFGSEKTGLSSKDLSHCHSLLHIPTRDEHVSMNLGQAVAVCLYDTRRQQRMAATLAQDSSTSAAASAAVTEPAEALATAVEVERMTGVLLDTLYASGYVNQPAPSDTEKRIRRLLRRMEMRSQDAEAWLGMLRQIAGKLRSIRATKP